MQRSLRDSRIFLIDGYTATGAVNDATPPTTGDTTVTVDGFTGIVPVGTTFVFGAGTVIHSVTSTVETSGNTTTINFTPAIQASGETVADNTVITVSGRRLELKVGDGNLTYSEKRNVEYKLERGRIDTVRLGDDIPMDVSFDIKWEFTKSDTAQPPTIEEVIKGQGNAGVWTSSSSDLCEPYAIDIFIVYTPLCTAEKLETALLKDFRWEELNHDEKAGMIQARGKCNVLEAVLDRITGPYY